MLIAYMSDNLFFTPEKRNYVQPIIEHCPFLQIHSGEVALWRTSRVETAMKNLSLESGKFGTSRETNSSALYEKIKTVLQFVLLQNLDPKGQDSLSNATT